MPHASSKKSLFFVQFWAVRGFCKRVLNSRICQHCDVKMSTVTTTFYYFFIIFLTCYISAPSFSYNLCQVLLLWNHLKTLLQEKCGQVVSPLDSIRSSRFCVVLCQPTAGFVSWKSQVQLSCHMCEWPTVFSCKLGFLRKNWSSLPCSPLSGRVSKFEYMYCRWGRLESWLFYVSFVGRYCAQSTLVSVPSPGY